MTRDVPPHALVVGNPARRAGWVCRCGERLGTDLACGSCGLRFARAGDDDRTGLAAIDVARAGGRP